MNKAERVDVSQLIADCRAGRVDSPVADRLERLIRKQEPGKYDPDAQASGKAPARRKQTKADPPELRDAKKIVEARSGGYCEARIEGVCEIQATNVHHIAGRGFDGCHDPALLLHVCGQGNVSGCHGYIEQHGGYEGWAQRHGHALPWGRPRAQPIAPVAGCSPDCTIDHRDET